MKNLREVNDDILREWFAYRDEDISSLKSAEDKKHWIYFDEIAEICAEKDILLILDEVQTGFGRCGTLFAHELFDIKADIMTIAKGVGGGVPMGAFLATEKVAGGFAPGDHGTTFGGGP